MSEENSISATVPEELAGKRLDQALAELFSDYSRSRLSQWIKEGKVRVDGVVKQKPRDAVFGGESIDVVPEVVAEERFEAENIALDIIYEDDDILVLNKPAGLVVHPAAGNWQGTMLNALLHHDPKLAEVPRAGIVHRLDKDTTGLLVVARTLQAQTNLVEQLQARAFEREYDAIVFGVMTAGGMVDKPIGRHSVDRKRQAVTESGKEAITHYRVNARFRGHTHIKCRLETGRTHQIRVHMQSLSYPLVGDSVYGGRLRIPKGCTEELREALRGFRRQALNATRLGLQHPRRDEWMEWSIDLPEDMQKLLAVMAWDAEQ